MTADALVVVQARMGSSRLPGKVLMDVGGRPMLGLMLDRLGPLRGHGLKVVLATSELGRDDPIEELARLRHIPVVRGSEGDVLSRFVTALQRHPADHVIRLTADCPLIDPDVVLEALAAHRAEQRDYTSNTLVRTFPDGLDVEVVGAQAIVDAHREATDPAEREHVTPFVYRRPRRYRLAQVTSPQPLGRERWTVDRAEDLDVIRRAVDAVDDPVHAAWPELLAALGRRVRPATATLRADPADPTTHQAGSPYQRRFHLRDGAGQPVADAVVEVDEGVGTLHLTAHAGRPRQAPEDVAAALDEWLGADLQVTRLLVGAAPTGAIPALASGPTEEASDGVGEQQV